MPPAWRRYRSRRIADCGWTRAVSRAPSAPLPARRAGSSTRSPGRSRAGETCDRSLRGSGTRSGMARTMWPRSSPGGPCRSGWSAASSGLRPRRLQFHGCRFDFPELRLPAGNLGLPLGRAAEYAGVRNRHGLARQHLVEGGAHVLGLHQRFALAVVDASLKAQDALLVEQEDVRRGLRAVRPRDLLSLAIVQVGEVEVPVLRADLHLFQG